MRVAVSMSVVMFTRIDFRLKCAWSLSHVREATDLVLLYTIKPMLQQQKTQYIHSNSTYDTLASLPRALASGCIRSLTLHRASARRLACRLPHHLRSGLRRLTLTPQTRRCQVCVGSSGSVELGIRIIVRDL